MKDVDVTAKKRHCRKCQRHRQQRRNHDQNRPSAVAYRQHQPQQRERSKEQMQYSFFTRRKHLQQHRTRRIESDARRLRSYFGLLHGNLRHKRNDLAIVAREKELPGKISREVLRLDSPRQRRHREVDLAPQLHSEPARIFPAEFLGYIVIFPTPGKRRHQFRKRHRFQGQTFFFFKRIIETVALHHQHSRIRADSAQIGKQPLGRLEFLRRRMQIFRFGLEIDQRRQRQNRQNQKRRKYRHALSPSTLPAAVVGAFQRVWRPKAKKIENEKIRHKAHHQSGRQEKCRLHQDVNP